ncbi:MAG: nucleotidyltransferase domain-containing protein [Candidatus Aminicenantes bacterium]|nr:nucleotidyltransferase domain-containing protein [Candidatus Aminicenantes bacterium]
MLTDVLIKSPEQRILSLFAMNPDRPFYVREISKKLKISLGAAHAALLYLEKAGILDHERAGKTKLYRLRGPNPIINSFRVLNTLIILEPLIEAIKGISRRAILFGSYAAGTFTASSDLDLFIVSGEKGKILARVDAFKRKTGLDIRPIIKDQLEWMKLDKDNPEFSDELGRGMTLWEKPVDESGI